MVHVVRNKIYFMYIRLYITFCCHPVLMMQLYEERKDEQKCGWKMLRFMSLVATLKNTLDQRHNRSRALVASSVQMGNPAPQHHQQLGLVRLLLPLLPPLVSHHDDRFPHAQCLPFSSLALSCLHHRPRLSEAAVPRKNSTDAVNIQSGEVEKEAGGESD